MHVTNIIQLTKIHIKIFNLLYKWCIKKKKKKDWGSSGSVGKKRVKNKKYLYLISVNTEHVVGYTTVYIYYYEFTCRTHSVAVDSIQFLCQVSMEVHSSMNIYCYEFIS